MFVDILEQTRLAYRFIVVGYVVMPEHFHLLMGEPERANPSVVMQVVKQRFAQNLNGRWRCDHVGKAWPWHDARQEWHVWQRRFMISWFGLNISTSKNLGICIAIRLNEDWRKSQEHGAGVVSGTTSTGSQAPCW